MEFLSDENVEPITIVWLRSLGHDVLSILETDPGIDDQNVLQRAAADGRIVITYDLDFGELIFRQQLSHSGIILLRFNDAKASDRLSRLQQHWHLIAGRCANSFIVVHDRRIRIRTIGSGR